LDLHYIELPKQLIHRDAHPGNMLFQDGQHSGWLDFEISMRGPRLFDLGYCSTSLLMNGMPDLARRQAWFGLLIALVTGYESVCPLTSVEHRALRVMQMCIEVIFIAFYANIHHSNGVAQNIDALIWLSTHPYEHV
jgi:Ser/Thr protein kinase RdoA (MazF antagonist)